MKQKQSKPQQEQERNYLADQEDSNNKGNKTKTTKPKYEHKS
jgi:hypothetical protein